MLKIDWQYFWANNFAAVCVFSFIHFRFFIIKTRQFPPWRRDAQLLNSSAPAALLGGHLVTAFKARYSLMSDEYSMLFILFLLFSGCSKMPGTAI